MSLLVRGEFMSMGGNNTGEQSKKYYEDKIKEMTGTKVKSIFWKLNKRELRQLKEAIEEARYKAIDEYKKGVAELE
jgi:hypothetical protein